jgi:hypothetical protein
MTTGSRSGLRRICGLLYFDSTGLKVGESVVLTVRGYGQWAFSPRGAGRNLTRGDGAWPESIDMAIEKARTVRLFD